MWRRISVFLYMWLMMTLSIRSAEWLMMAFTAVTFLVLLSWAEEIEDVD